MSSSQAATAERATGLRFVARGRRNRNGAAKCPTASRTLALPQVPCSRWRKKTVSSGRFPYQIRKYCEKPM